MSKLVFKASFSLCILVVEQVSFLLSMLWIYGDSLRPLSLRQYVYCLPVMLLASLILLDYYKLSYFQRKPLQNILFDSFRFVGLFTAVVCIYAYLMNFHSLSRWSLVVGGVISYVLVAIVSVAAQKWSPHFYARGKLLIVSHDEEGARTIAAKVRHEERHLNLELIGWILPENVSDDDPLFAHCTDVLIAHNVEESKKNEVLLACSQGNKSVYIVPSFYDLSFSKYRLVKFYDTPTFQVENYGLTFQQQVLKRIFDVAFSAAILFVASPVFAVIAILIKLDSKGPVFYTQDRITNNGRVYKVYKFRSMVEAAESLYGAFQSSAGDARVTRVGRILRNTHLDELPQFLNVLLGSMSVVGPRSDRTITIDMLEEQTFGYGYRLKVKSGITGLAQLFGKYNSDPADKLRYDIYYIKNYSFILDLQIILLTVGALFPRADNYNEEKAESDYFIEGDRTAK